MGYPVALSELHIGHFCVSAVDEGAYCRGGEQACAGYFHLLMLVRLPLSVLQRVQRMRLLLEAIFSHVCEMKRAAVLVVETVL